MPDKMGKGAAVSWASSEGVRRSMRSNRPRDTAPEVALRSALHRLGLRFRKHLRPDPRLACTVDVAFPTERLAVFVDGCYWHSCPDHVSFPVTHGDWWRAKLDATRERDRRNSDALTAAGWTVLRIWEHEDVHQAAIRVSATLAQIRGTGIGKTWQPDALQQRTPTNPTNATLPISAPTLMISARSCRCAGINRHEGRDARVLHRRPN